MVPFLNRWFGRCIGVTLVNVFPIKHVIHFAGDAYTSHLLAIPWLVVGITYDLAVGCRESVPYVCKSKQLINNSLYTYNGAERYLARALLYLLETQNYQNKQ